MTNALTNSNSFNFWKTIQNSISYFLPNRGHSGTGMNGTPDDASEPEVNIDRLPNEMIADIFAFLKEGAEKASLGSVCKKYYNICLNVSPIRQGCCKLYEALFGSAKEFGKAIVEQGFDENLLKRFNGLFSKNLKTIYQPKNNKDYWIYYRFVRAMMKSAIKEAAASGKKVDNKQLEKTTKTVFRYFETNYITKFLHPILSADTRRIIDNAKKGIFDPS